MPLDEETALEIAVIELADAFASLKWDARTQRARAVVSRSVVNFVNTRFAKYESIVDTLLGVEIFNKVLLSVCADLGVVSESNRAENLMIPSDQIVADLLWEKNGFPTFTITSGLMDMLLLTDPGNLSQNDVPWPFDAFRVVIPQPSLIRIQGDEFTAIRVSKGRGVPSPGVAKALLGAKVECFDIDSAISEVDKFANTVGLVPFTSLHITSAARRSFHVAAPWSGSSVKDWLEAKSFEDALITDECDLVMKMSQRLIVNLALYLDTHDESGSATWTPSAKSEGRSNNWTVGRTVKVGPEVHRAANAVARGEQATCPSIRHIVRGHFRNQPVGTGRSERKRIYIKPFWRGPADGPVVDRDYKVG